MISLSFQGLAKRYLIGKEKDRTGDACPELNLGFTRVPLPRLWRRPNPARELWALRDVSVDVTRGTVLGLVGANGAGKSTLLKIVARVTRPTEGRVVGRGRVVSLLELGAGFNPDFSARDNILMNAAMHGVTRHEALSRLDEIIAFAEIEHFIDSPVRHFSSGMYLRLAFSVAINMQPDILLADEILAVGDAAFQERCLDRVAQEAKKGLTVLFVSHDMQAIARICDRVVWLDRGRIVQCGDPTQVVADYQAGALGKTNVGGDEEQGPHISYNAEILNVRLLNAAGEVVGAVGVTEDAFVRIRVKARKADVALRGMVDISTKGTFLFRSVQDTEAVSQERAIVDLIVRIPAHLLAEQSYAVNVAVTARHLEKESHVSLPKAVTFMVYGGAQATRDYKAGLIAPQLDWSATSYSNEPRGKRQQQPVA